MAATNGSGWFVLIGGTTITDKIVCQTSASADISQDTIEVTCKDGTWKTYISGEKGWTIPFEAIKDETETSVQAEILENILGAGGELDVAIVHAPNGTIVKGMSGKAILSSVSISVPKNEAATLSGTLQGTGALTKMVIGG